MSKSKNESNDYSSDEDILSDNLKNINDTEDIINNETIENEDIENEDIEDTIEEIIDEDKEDLDENLDIFNDDKPDNIINKNIRVPDNERITIPKLTKYERVRLLGTRSKQISDGSKIFIKSDKIENAMDIAKLELQHKVIPLKIKRPLPNGNY